MGQLFSRSANTLAGGSLLLLAVGFCVFGWSLYTINRSAYVNREQVEREQPVPFSHQHHVGGLGLDCRYCHTTVETSAYAGLPPTHTCMTCHSRLWTQANLLAPVRRSYRDNQPLAWTRVYDLSDFVYFNHSIHIAKGIGCETCHGRVDRMPLMRENQPLFMEWCLDCHRHPEKYVRPREAVFTMGYKPPEDQLSLGRRLVKEYGIQSRTDCIACHR